MFYEFFAFGAGRSNSITRVVRLAGALCCHFVVRAVVADVPAIRRLPGPRVTKNIRPMPRRWLEEEVRHSMAGLHHPWVLGCNHRHAHLGEHRRTHQHARARAHGCALQASDLPKFETRSAAGVAAMLRYERPSINAPPGAARLEIFVS